MGEVEKLFNEVVELGPGRKLGFHYSITDFSFWEITGLWDWHDSNISSIVSERAARLGALIAQNGGRVGSIRWLARSSQLRVQVMHDCARGVNDQHGLGFFEERLVWMDHASLVSDRIERCHYYTQRPQHLLDIGCSGT